MNRAEKIKFLQDMQKGKVTPGNLMPKQLTRMIGYGNGPADDPGSIYFIDDTEVSQGEFEEAERWLPSHSCELGYGPEIEKSFGL